MTDVSWEAKKKPRLRQVVVPGASRAVECEVKVCVSLNACTGVCACSQRPVLRLVLGQDVLAASELFPQVGHLLPQGTVLLLQEAGSDGDLVLLEPPSVTGPLGCHVVLPAPGPVFVILLEKKRGKKRGINSKLVFEAH